MRRTFLAQSLAAVGLLTLTPARVLSAPALLISNNTGLYGVEVAKIATPTSTEEVVQSVRSWPGQIGIGGARYSMGGQIAAKGGLHIDMRAMNQLVWLNAEAKTVRVQAGATWRAVQDWIDPVNLSIQIMQSFANFTVGGAVSVNAHGRYVGKGPVGHSVRALQLVLANGAIVEASRTENTALFRAAIGGYGAVGVITEVELDLADNVKIERSVQAVALADYPQFFQETVASDGLSIFHNADLAPPLFNAPVAVTWRQTDKALTVTERLTAHGQSHALNQGMLLALSELPGSGALRSKVVQPLLQEQRAVTWRNHEASLDVAVLEPASKRSSTYALAEYFIAERHFVAFATEMAQVIQKHQANVLNVSIRHSPPDTVALLPWAKEAVFSFVVYYKQRTTEAAQQQVGEWTREMIDTALRYGGRYYLPYQLHASARQFQQAYPEAPALASVKKTVDAKGQWSNALWAQYL